jgi:hypothetical protein
LALIWEIRRRGARLAWGVLGIITACAMLSHLASNKTYVLARFEAVDWLLMVASMFLTFGIFHFVEAAPGRNWHGFPQRLFAMPVSTVTLVACPMILSLAAVEVVYGAWAKLVFAPLGRTVSIWPAAVLGVGILCYQSIIWSLAGYRITRVLALALMGLVLANVAALPLLAEISVWPKQTVFRAGSISLALLAITAVATAWLAVERQRHGGGRGQGRIWGLLARAADALPRRRRPFATAASAQFWHDWRRGGTIMPSCAAAVLFLICAPLSWLMRADPQATLWTAGWVLALPFLLSATVGIGFIKPEFWSAEMGITPFLAIRPISSGTLVMSKMKVAAASVAATWILTLGFLAAYLSLWANPKELRVGWTFLSQYYSPFDLMAMMTLAIALAPILQWRMMAAGLWVGLSGNGRLFVGAIIMRMAGLVFLVWGAAWFGNLFWTHLDQVIHHAGALALCLLFLAALKFALAAWSWRSLAVRRARNYLGLWWLATLGFAGFVFLLNPSYPPVKTLLALLAFLIVPLARIGLAPAFLDKNRHR